MRQARPEPCIHKVGAECAKTGRISPWFSCLSTTLRTIPLLLRACSLQELHDVLTLVSLGSFLLLLAAGAGGCLAKSRNATRTIRQGAELELLSELCFRCLGCNGKADLAHKAAFFFVWKKSEHVDLIDPRARRSG